MYVEMWNLPLLAVTLVPVHGSNFLFQCEEFFSGFSIRHQFSVCIRNEIETEIEVSC